MWIARVSVVVAVGLASAPGALSQCRPAAVDPCSLVLHGESAPGLEGSCGDEVWKSHLTFELPERFADANDDEWHESVLRLDLDPDGGCRCALFRVTFEGEPSGQTINIGDSPTNDGYGGDSWSTVYDAELLLSNTDFSGFGAEPAESQIFGLRRLPFADQVLELEVCDQSVRFAVGELHGFFNTYVGRELISIRPKTEGVDDSTDSRIYASFNRVIHRRAGLPAHGRFGSGVRRVEISLSP